MAKRTVKKRVIKTKKSSGDPYSFLIPSGLGGVVAWVFSGNLMLGITVFAALYIGNWMGNQYRKNR